MTDPDLDRAVDLVRLRPPRLGPVRLVAVDGPSGSGKTTVAAALADLLAQRCGGRVVRPVRIAGAEVAGPPEPRDRPARDGPAATVTVLSTDLLATWEHPLDWWPVLEQDLLQPLAEHRTAVLPVIAWVSGHPRPGGHVVVDPPDVLVLEGVSAGRRAVADRLTALLWVEVPDPAERLARAVARDGAEMRPFLRRWQRQEDAHFTTDGTRIRADAVLNR